MFSPMPAMEIPPPEDRLGFEIAVICALPKEANVVEIAFDTYWSDNEDLHYGRAEGDPNFYTYGRMGHHDVVVLHMGRTGTTDAGTAVASMRSSFHNIKLALVVGICAGVPFGADGKTEILLGDVVVSTQVIEYDFGKQFPGGFQRKRGLDTLGRAPESIRSFTSGLGTIMNLRRLSSNTDRYLKDICEKLGYKGVRYPGAENDRLFESAYRHEHHEPGCDICVQKEDSICEIASKLSCEQIKCDKSKLIPRERLIALRNSPANPSDNLQQQLTEVPKPTIHLGAIASANTAMKSAMHRNAIALCEKVIGFEMEGAGVWEKFPCLVIKGVCDYADSHKNDTWQEYAATTAAACLKAVLREWQSARSSSHSPRPSQSSGMSEQSLLLSASPGFDSGSGRNSHEAIRLNSSSPNPGTPRSSTSINRAINQNLAMENFWNLMRTASEHLRKTGPQPAYEDLQEGGRILETQLQSSAPGGAFVAYYSGLTEYELQWSAIHSTHSKRLKRLQWAESHNTRAQRALAVPNRPQSPLDAKIVEMYFLIIRARRIEIQANNEGVIDTNAMPSFIVLLNKIKGEMQELGRTAYDTENEIQKISAWIQVCEKLLKLK